MTSPYDKTKQIIREAVLEFGGQAQGLDEIIVDRIKDSGLKIEQRANAKKPAANTTKE